MTYSAKTLDNSQVELTITVEQGTFDKELEQAARKISEKSKVKGFRIGKAPYDVVKRQFGEMAILQEALEEIIKHSYYQAVVEEKLQTLGMPQITVEKVAPGNDIVYKATVALLPKVELPNIDKVSVKINKKAITEEEVQETIDALRGMQAKEVEKEGKATKDDKITIDMNMLLDGVAIEGGQSHDYQVYLSEKHYIPGFNDELIGMEVGETKEFTLDFPKDHYQKQLAGKKVTFQVTAKKLEERQLPEFDDSFATKLGQTSAEALKDIIKSNMARESHTKSMQQAEIEILETLIEKTKFDPIPEVLVNSEKQKMYHELKNDIERTGVSVQKYLEDLKKTEEELFNDFQEQADKRAKAALISRQIAAEQNISVGEEELKNEVEMLKEMYKDNPEYVANLDKPVVQDTIATSMQNKKVMHWLSSKILGKQIQEDEELKYLGCAHDHEHSDDCSHS